MRITIRKRVLLIALSALISATLNAQNANYDAAPVRGFPFVVITGVKFKDCENGVPTEKELSNLDKVSDSVYANVTTLVKNIMAGTFTYQCERLEYYYVADTTQIRERLTILFKKHFNSYEPYINIKADKDWDAYLKFLYPNDETLEYMQNEKLLMALEKEGDKLEKERRVDHWIFFSTENDMNCFMPYATQQGFKVERKENKDKAFKLHISRTDKVDLSSISKITSELRKEAKHCNGIYDGWKTVVIK